MDKYLQPLTTNKLPRASKQSQRPPLHRVEMSSSWVTFHPSISLSRFGVLSSSPALAALATTHLSELRLSRLALFTVTHLHKPSIAFTIQPQSILNFHSMRTLNNSHILSPPFITLGTEA